MPDTAKRFGVTDPYDEEQNIEAGTKYLRFLLDRYRDTDDPVARAVAGYNAGEGAVDKHNGIPPYKETQAYVPKVLQKRRELFSRYNSPGQTTQTPAQTTQPSVEVFPIPGMDARKDVANTPAPKFARPVNYDYAEDTIYPSIDLANPGQVQRPRIAHQDRRREIEQVVTQDNGNITASTAMRPVAPGRGQAAPTTQQPAAGFSRSPQYDPNSNVTIDVSDYIKTGATPDQTAVAQKIYRELGFTDEEAQRYADQFAGGDVSAAFYRANTPDAMQRLVARAGGDGRVAIPQLQGNALSVIRDFLRLDRQKQSEIQKQNEENLRLSQLREFVVDATDEEKMMAMERIASERPLTDEERAIFGITEIPGVTDLGTIARGAGKALGDAAQGFNRTFGSTEGVVGKIGKTFSDVSKIRENIYGRRGALGEVERGVGAAIPALALRNPYLISGFTGLETYGQGASAEDALKTGALTLGVLKGGGAIGKMLTSPFTNAPAQVLLTEAEEAVVRRVAAQTGKDYEVLRKAAVDMKLGRSGSLGLENPALHTGRGSVSPIAQGVADGAGYALADIAARKTFTGELPSAEQLATDVALGIIPGLLHYVPKGRELFARKPSALDKPAEVTGESGVRNPEYVVQEPKQLGAGTKQLPGASETVPGSTPPGTPPKTQPPVKPTYGEVVDLTNGARRDVTNAPHLSTSAEPSIQSKTYTLEDTGATRRPDIRTATAKKVADNTQYVVQEPASIQPIQKGSVAEKLVNKAKAGEGTESFKGEYVRVRQVAGKPVIILPRRYADVAAEVFGAQPGDSIDGAFADSYAVSNLQFTLDQLGETDAVNELEEAFNKSVRNGKVLITFDVAAARHELQHGILEGVRNEYGRGFDLEVSNRLRSENPQEAEAIARLEKTLTEQGYAEDFKAMPELPLEEILAHLSAGTKQWGYLGLGERDKETGKLALSAEDRLTAAFAAKHIRNTLAETHKDLPEDKLFGIFDQITSAARPGAAKKLFRGVFNGRQQPSQSTELPEGNAQGSAPGRGSGDTSFPEVSGIQPAGDRRDHSPIQTETEQPATVGNKALKLQPKHQVSTKSAPSREPNKHTQKIAAKIAKKVGRKAESVFKGSTVRFNEDLAKRVADEYEAAQHDPNNPEVKKTYRAFIKDNLEQYRNLEKAGYKFEPYLGKGEPYANSAEVMADVRDNKHLYFFLSKPEGEAGGFGEGDDLKTDHPLLQDSGIKINGIPLTHNDVFRVVHDIFGHTTHGHQFGATGEARATHEHSKMYSEDALPAMIAETLGQNSWVNAGKHLRDESGKIREGLTFKDKPFAEQKAVVLSPETMQAIREFYGEADETNVLRFSRVAPEREDEYRQHVSRKKDVLRDFEAEGFTAESLEKETTREPKPEHIGRRVFVYFNLHKLVFSAKALDGKEAGRVLFHTPAVELTDVTFKVSEAGRQRVLKEQRKNVHAGVTGKVKDFPEPADVLERVREATEGTYNPYKYSSFVDKATEQPIGEAEDVILSERKIYFGKIGSGTKTKFSRYTDLSKEDEYRQSIQVRTELNQTLKRTWGTSKAEKVSGGHWILSDGTVTGNVDHPRSARRALADVTGEQVKETESRQAMTSKNGAVRLLLRNDTINVEVPAQISVEQLNTISRIVAAKPNAEFRYDIYDPSTAKMLSFGSSYADFKREPTVQKMEFEEDLRPGVVYFARKPVDPFFSTLAKVLDKKMPVQAPVKQVRDLLDNPQNGVKKDERRWSDIDTYLDSIPAGEKVSKTKLAEWVQAHSLQIKETFLLNQADKDKAAWTNERLLFEAQQAVKLVKIKLKKVLLETKTPEEVAEIFRITIDNQPFALESVRKLQERIGSLADEYAVRVDYLHSLQERHRSTQKLEDTQYSDKDYNLAGGTFYREVLFNLPTAKPGVDLQSALEQALPKYDVKITEGLSYRFRPKDPTLALQGWHTLEKLSSKDRQKVSEVNRQHEAANNTFRASHFSPHNTNLVAHARIDDVEKNGRKFLRVQEIQSDLENRLRDSTTEPGEKAKLEKLMPFTDYTQFVWKRILRMAAEGDYDGVVWTTGAQQIDRWNNQLRQNVDEVRWSVPTATRIAGRETTVRVEGLKNGKSVTNLQVPLIGKTVMAGQPAGLEQLLGSKMADEIRNSQETSGVFKDDNLSIGGQGKKVFYDEMPKNFLNKYLKRFGVRVGKQDFGVNPYSKDIALSFKGLDWDEPEVFDELDRMFDLHYNDPDAALEIGATINAINGIKAIHSTMIQDDLNFEEAAVKAFDDADRLSERNITAALDYLHEKFSGVEYHFFDVKNTTLNQTLHSIPVTPEMKESFLYEGQALFARKPQFEMKVKGYKKDPAINGISQDVKPEQYLAGMVTVDKVQAKHPTPLESEKHWGKYLADLFSTDKVLIPPYKALEYKQSPKKIVELLKRQSAKQKSSVDAGMQNAREIYDLYTTGKLGVESTGEFVLWGILSRRLSAYAQEGAFLDAIQAGVEKFIKIAAQGRFNAKTLETYKKWAYTASSEESPGRQALYNLSDFGKFLVKGSQRVKEGEYKGKTALQALHEMLSNPALDGKAIRRNFFSIFNKPGIDSKVVSFILLVSGRDDVMIFDRIQIRHLWDNAARVKQYGTTNIYEKEGDAGYMGNQFKSLGGLAMYEAIESQLAEPVTKAYELAGRPEDASLGRFHWESWLIEGVQETAHNTTTVIGKRATGESVEGIGVMQGKFDTFTSGLNYKIVGGKLAHTVFDSSGVEYVLTPEQKREYTTTLQNQSKKTVEDRILPYDFKVSEKKTESWQNDSRVNREALDRLIHRLGTRLKTEVQKPATESIQKPKFARTGQYTHERLGKVTISENQTGVPKGKVRVLKEDGTPSIVQAVTNNQLMVRDKTQPAKITDSPEFKKWFGDSKVVDENGEPLVVYHGSRVRGIKEFEFDRSGSGVVGVGVRGAVFFTSSRENAAYYTDPNYVQSWGVPTSEDSFYIYGNDPYFVVIEDEDGETYANFGGFSSEEEAEEEARRVIRKNNALVQSGESGVVYEESSDDLIYPVYLSIKHPKVIDKIPTTVTASVKQAKEEGFDGVILKDILDGAVHSDVFVAFNPNQIKSAHNKGSFSTTDNRILFARGKAKEIADKIQTLRKAGLLTGIQGIYRDVGSQAVAGTLEELSRIPASMVDYFVSQSTGERTVTAPEFKQALQSTNAVRKQARTVIVNTLKNGAPLTIQQAHNLANQPAFKNPFLQAYVQTVFALRSIPDQLANIYAVERSKQMQAMALAKSEALQGTITKADVKRRADEIYNGVGISQALRDRIDTQAVEDALFSTFQNTNELMKSVDKFVSRVQRKYDLLPIEQAYDTLLPFRNIPANVVARSLDYSPVGWVKAGGKFKRFKNAKELTAALKAQGTGFIGNVAAGGGGKGTLPPDIEDLFAAMPEDGDEARKKIAQAILNGIIPDTKAQKEFVESVGRASIGTVVFGLGILAAMAGIQTGLRMYEQEKRNVRQAANIPDGATRIPGTDIWLETQTNLGGFGFMLTVGATAYEKWTDELKDESKRFANLSSILGQVIGQHNLAQASRELLDAITHTGSATQRAGRGLENIASSFLPTLGKDVAEIMDGKRSTASPGGQLKAKIPFVSRTLPEAKDALGQTQEVSLATKLLPFAPRKQRRTPVVDELLRTNTGVKQSVRKEGETPADLAQRRSSAGTERRKQLEQMVQSEEYRNAPDSVKKEALQDAVTSTPNDKLEGAAADTLQANAVRIVNNAEIARSVREKVLEVQGRDDFKALPKASQSEITKQIKALYNRFSEELKARPNADFMRQSSQVKRDYFQQFKDQLNEQAERIFEWHLNQRGNR